MSVGSTCRLHASQTFKSVSLYKFTYGIGEPSKLLTKAGCNICYQQLDILQAVNTSVAAAL